MVLDRVLSLGVTATSGDSSTQTLPECRALMDQTQPTDQRLATQWLLEERAAGRAERRLLEDLIRFKDDDLEEHRHRLATSQRQVSRLWQDLKECWSKLLQRRRHHDQLVADNIRLLAKNSELRILIAQMGCKRREHEHTLRFKCMDTDL